MNLYSELCRDYCPVLRQRHRDLRGDERRMTGDPSILIAKLLLDFFTAMIFACSLGIAVSVIGIPLH